MISPAAHTLSAEVCIFSSTLMPFLKCSRLRVSIPARFGFLPTQSSISEASIVCSLPSESAYITLPVCISRTLDDRCMLMPFFVKSSRSIDDISVSIPGSISGAISITVTFVPNVENRPANSMPITPPPIIIRLSGTSFVSRASFDVQKFAVSTPLMGGMATTEPVQIRSLDASKSSLLQVILTMLFVLLTIEVSPEITVMLLWDILVRMPALSFLTILFFRLTILSYSKLALSMVIPYFLLLRALLYSLELYRRVLVGIHPSLRQHPPSAFFSKRITLRPCAPARSAAVYPAGPPPKIAKSNIFLFL